jgi:Baseplate J-like protein
MGTITQQPTLICPTPILRPGMQGIERVAVDDQNATLLVTFYQPILSPDQSFLLKPSSYTLTGGQRLFPHITQADLVPASMPSGPTQILLTLDGEGDFSIYTLTVSGPNVDPFFGSRQLRFRLACEDRFDCRAAAVPAPPPPELPVVIDYLAKDYSSFRQGLLDFITTRYPDWSERSEADIGMMLLELFSYTADNLSYMQDRVAGEAFLSTATQRRSVAGHLQLIGYQMDEGASAYTWLQFQVKEVHVVTSSLKISNQPVADSEPVLVFEPLAPTRLDPAHNSIELYTWGNTGCCLPATALSAALSGSLPNLQLGDYLLFDDGAGQSDIVRLSAEPLITAAPVLDAGSPPGGMITIVSWSAETPLSGSYCATGSVVRGNLAVATHGETVTAPDIFVAPPPSTQRLRFDLSQSPLAHLDPATAALVAPQDSATAPPVSYTEVAARSISTLSVTVGGDLTPWQQVPSLLDSSATAQAYRVEIDDTGLATIVFGQGGSGSSGDEFGLRPAANSQIVATYRVGGGALGNVAAGTLVEPHPASNDDLDWFVSVTNPLPAAGGRDLESRDHARRNAPFEFQQPIVAVTVEDYELAAQNYTDANGDQPIERATASFQWTGSWLTVTLVVEVHGTETLSADLRSDLLTYLDGRRLAGYDLEILAPSYVPIDLIISFCTKAGYSSSSVQQQIETVLSNTILPGGVTGFFYPDNFSFGQSLYVSQLFAAVMSVPGVLSAQLSRLALLHSIHPDQETQTNLAQGYLSVGPNQILRLDNDRNFPENGVLTVQTMGGTA